MIAKFLQTTYCYFLAKKHVELYRNQVNSGIHNGLLYSQRNRLMPGSSGIMLPLVPVCFMEMPLSSI